jgi:hypothetical protein
MSDVGTKLSLFAMKRGRLPPRKEKTNDGKLSHQRAVGNKTIIARSEKIGGVQETRASHGGADEHTCKKATRDESREISLRPVVHC